MINPGNSQYLIFFHIYKAMKYFSTKYINAKNLIYNYKLLCKKSGHKIIAVVKANAYGHGANNVVNILSPYCNFFATENLQEAIALRKINKNIKILVLGYCTDFQKAKEEDICITCDNLSQLKEIAKINGKIKLHLKINTGMNRLGIKTKRQFIKILKFIKKNTKLKLDGIFTHCFESKNERITNIQIEIFKKYLKLLKKLSFKDYVVHIGGSGLINYKLDFVDYIRCGIALYGYQDSSVKKVEKIESQVIKITDIKKGEFVGYGETKVKTNKKIAIIPLGYADGLPRIFEKLFVLFGHQKLNVIGRLCMDMFMIDVTNTKIKIGDVVTVFYDATLWVKGTSDTEYDVLTRLNNARTNNFIVVEK